MKYPLTFYWAKGVGKGAAASTRLCVIFIKPEYRGDEGLYQHELMHVKQWAFVSLVSALLIAAVYWPLVGMAMAVHPLVYAMSRSYRLCCEVQAYKRQLKYYPDDRTIKFTGYIVKHYGLDISHQAVEEMLRK
jgi:hypothetical protein